MANNIKRKRMLLYFIEAAQEIIEKEGYDAVTIRKVADLAGYNSATLYSYFDNLDQLILYASLKYLRDYNQDAARILQTTQSAYEKYIAMWESFCIWSFRWPKPYAYIFSVKHSDNVDDIATKYYELYPEDMGTDAKELYELLKSFRLEDRNFTQLKTIISRDSADWNNLVTINEMTVILYRGLLEQRLQDQLAEQEELYRQKMMRYIHYLMQNMTFAE